MSNEQWTDERIEAEIRANAEYKLGEAIDIAEVVRIIRQMRDDMLASHDELATKVRKLTDYVTELQFSVDGTAFDIDDMLAQPDAE